MMDQDWKSVAAAFSKQAEHYDEDDTTNPILPLWRKRVYRHTEKFLRPNSRILELNSGTGIDAIYFAQRGHQVLATDIAPGMIDQIRLKVSRHNLGEKVEARLCSFRDLSSLIPEGPFDHIFSNFGGLNCLPSLATLQAPLDTLLKPGGMLTFVVMPPVCPWEMLTIVKGNRNAFRRLSKDGVDAQVEGFRFRTFYHSVSMIGHSLSPSFEMVSVHGLGIFSPPPSSAAFVHKYPGSVRVLSAFDRMIEGVYPFRRWGDHVVVSMKRSLWQTR